MGPPLLSPQPQALGERRPPFQSPARRYHEAIGGALRPSHVSGVRLRMVESAPRGAQALPSNMPLAPQGRAGVGG
eukprot:11202326-Lingulodinium_polyedra.AAC.1